MWLLLLLICYFGVLFNFYVFVNFPNFLLLLISNLIPLWLENILCMMSILLNLLSLVLWSNIWSILENIPYALEKNMYYAVWGWSVLHITVRSSWFIAFFNCFTSLLIFYPLLKVRYFFLHLYWSIIALQWCVSLCCITKWISYTYTYIPISPPSCISLPPSLSHPSKVVTKHRADLPVLCGCFPLVIYFTFGSV